MNQREFSRICRALQMGEDKFLEHLETHYTGRVIACSGERFEVDVAGRRESWAREACEETMGSRYGHKERSLDAPPWSIDRFNPYR